MLAIGRPGDLPYKPIAETSPTVFVEGLRESRALGDVQWTLDKPVSIHTQAARKSARDG
jgi:hypothetical protein